MNPGTPPAPEERASATGLLRAVALYIEARGRLLHIEGQEAGSRLINLTGMVMLAFAAFGIGWMLAAPALVYIIAESNGWPWTRVALAGAGIHLFLGLLLLAGLKSKLRGMQLFEETLNQFSRDREWLIRNKND
ncbi:MAG: phage holin family protein [Prosthecobacter sp.]|uniref:phage holin family protein n=1 Tax=Prosthecobacter sp. TaxID=1965333 RepID=UPI0025DF31A1|nr:phage holin family protein [Prosthecobacter sp.]MCF7784903.1 phage holin family protein [Prosthecobacter sp.]